jgi:uncharacterized protein
LIGASTADPGGVAPEAGDWRRTVSEPNLFAPLFTRGTRTHRLVNRTRDLVIAARIEPAFDSRARRKGLLGRQFLPSDVVLAIAPSNGIHTFGMHFPIDLLFVTRDGTVVKRVLSLRARRLSACWRAFAVLEFAAGNPGVSATRTGDRLAVEENPED